MRNYCTYLICHSYSLETLLMFWYLRLTVAATGSGATFAIGDLTVVVVAASLLLVAVVASSAT